MLPSCSPSLYLHVLFNPQFRTTLRACFPKPCPAGCPLVGRTSEPPLQVRSAGLARLHDATLHGRSAHRGADRRGSATWQHRELVRFAGGSREGPRPLEGCGFSVCVCPGLCEFGARLKYFQTHRHAAFVIQPRCLIPCIPSPSFTSSRHFTPLRFRVRSLRHGQVVALSGRDCSTQRRFQKIFEEGPPVIAAGAVFVHGRFSAHPPGWSSPGGIIWTYPEKRSSKV